MVRALVVLGSFRTLIAGAARYIVGYGAIALVVAGVWGLYGWQWAAIVAGSVPAAFFVYGEARASRMAD